MQRRRRARVFCGPPPARRSLVFVSGRLKEPRGNAENLPTCAAGLTAMLPLPAPDFLGFWGAGLAFLIGAGTVVWLLYRGRTRNVTFRRIRGIEEVSADYDAFILDAYGVLRDADRALPGALDCVSSLHSRGKKLAVVSNSTSLDQAEQLRNLGIDPSYFRAVGVLVR
eukprot:scaffold1951_cov258-Pinguiococcus_pyrenoidosus.AAC.21